MTTLRATFFVLIASLSIGGGLAGAGGGPHSPDWEEPVKIVGTGDFTGDGKLDILWRRDASGELEVWRMDGINQLDELVPDPLAVSDLRWRVCGTGDFNDDGKVDILWRHETAGQLVVWFMDGTTMVSGDFIDTSALTDLDWRVKATGDFNGDGQADILWQHKVSGQVAVWFMDGLTRTGGTFTSPETAGDVDWVATATGDFDRDGKVDIVWRHSTSGETIIWYMNGTVRVGETHTGTQQLDLHWKLVGTGDLDGDGNVDLFWQGPPEEWIAPTGQNVVWLMGNANVKPGGVIRLPDNY